MLPKNISIVSRKIEESIFVYQCFGLKSSKKNCSTYFVLFPILICLLMESISMRKKIDISNCFPYYFRFFLRLIRIGESFSFQAWINYENMYVATHSNCLSRIEIRRRYFKSTRQPNVSFSKYYWDHPHPDGKYRGGICSVYGLEWKHI